MTTTRSKLYQFLPQTTATYEPVGPVPTECGLGYRVYFHVTIPVGFTTADIIKLVPFQNLNFPTQTTQVGGLRYSRVVLRCAGDVGGSVTVNFGGLGGTGQTSATAFASASTALQSAGTTDIAIATVMAAGPSTTSDEIQLVAAAGTSTTARVVDGFIEFYTTAPSLVS